MNGQRPNGGPGRGRKMTLQGKARECAIRVVDSITSCRSNRLYNAAYFGAAMRGHVALMEKEGLVMGVGVQTLVDQAERILKVECDGKDCRFIETPLG